MQNENLTDESSDSENSDSDDEEGIRRVYTYFEKSNFSFLLLVLNGRYKNVNQLEWDNTTM